MPSCYTYWEKALTREDRIIAVLADNIGGYKRGGGNEYTFNCPYCEFRSGSPDTGKNLWVNPVKRSASGVKGCFQCWRCGWKGDVNRLLKFLNLPEEGREEHVDNLDDHVQQPLFTWARTGAQSSTHRPLSFASDLLSDTFPLAPNKPSSGPALEYLGRRGFDWADAGALRGALRLLWQVLGVGSSSRASRTGSWSTSPPGRLRGRTSGKYLNPPKDIVPIGRENVVFNIDSLEPGQPCIIVEGQLNAMILGLRAVACLGKQVTEVQIAKLIAKGCSEYICGLDDDAWEQNIALAKTLAGRTKAKVTLVEWPRGQDAVDLGRQESMMRILDRTEYSLASHFIGPSINVFRRRRSR
jgi:hypothetical protein